MVRVSTWRRFGVVGGFVPQCLIVPILLWKIRFDSGFQRLTTAGVHPICASFTDRLKANQPSPVRKFCGFTFWASHIRPNPSAKASKSTMPSYLPSELLLRALVWPESASTFGEHVISVGQLGWRIRHSRRVLKVLRRGARKECGVSDIGFVTSMPGSRPGSSISTS